MLYNLHLLRALAALGVVYFHITSEAGLDLSFNVGAHGVDVFFVISGFIISRIGQQEPRDFLVRRLIRIVPFYWAATLVVFAAAAVLPGLFRSTQADVRQLVCSLLFIPRETTYAGMFPTLLLGWSLNYEMYFYLLFTLALLLTRRFAPIACCAAIVAIAWLIHVSGTVSPSVRFYARPLVFEFAFGVGAYYALRWFESNASRLRANGALRNLCAAVVTAATVALILEEHYRGFGLPRFLSAGLPALALVLAALVLECVYGLRARSRLIHLLGESSYILYLVHPYIVYGVLRTILRDEHALQWPALIGVIGGLMALASAIAIALHVWLERPVMQFLRGKFAPISARPSPAAPPRRSAAG